MEEICRSPGSVESQHRGRAATKSGTATAHPSARARTSTCRTRSRSVGFLEALDPRSGTRHLDATPSSRSRAAMRVLVEAAGIEPASRNTRATGFYVRVPRFGSRPLDAHGRASIGPVSVLSRRFAPRRNSPASPLCSSPPGRGHSGRKRLPDESGCEREIVGMQCRPEMISGVTRDPRHATWRQVKPVETGAPPFRLRRV
jgi:hypothetical protein